MKTQHCDQCKKASWTGLTMTCTAGHKPRFKMPGVDLYDFGYRRRCEDFEKVEKDEVNPLQTETDM
jgi:hypothetical protein